jgi:hypothetical protein
MMWHTDPLRGGWILHTPYVIMVKFRRDASANDHRSKLATAAGVGYLIGEPGPTRVTTRANFVTLCEVDSTHR